MFLSTTLNASETYTHEDKHSTELINILFGRIARVFLYILYIDIENQP